MSYQEVFEAIEKLKLEHPEIVRAIEVSEQTRRICEVYQRILDAQKPKYRIVTTTGTGQYINE